MAHDIMESPNETVLLCQYLFLTTDNPAIALLVGKRLVDEAESEEEKRNRYRRERYALLTEEERKRRVRKVPRAGTKEPRYSQWNYLYLSNNLEGYITVLGLDPDCFRELLRQFKPLFDRYSPYPKEDGLIRVRRTKRGRPRKVSAHACLGMVLFWTRTTCYYWTIAQYFGLTGSPCELWLRFGKRVLLEVNPK